MVICTLGEPEEHQVLHRFLAQVVIDAKHVSFVEGHVQRAIELPRRRQIAAEGLLEHDARTVCAAGAGEPLHHGGEGAGGNGQVVQRPPGVTQRLAQAIEDRRVVVVAAHVAEQAGQLREGVGIDTAAVCLDAVAGAGAKAVDVPILPGHGDHGHVEPAAARHGLERGKDLLVGEVSGRAEEHQRVGLKLAHRTLRAGVSRSSSPGDHRTGSAWPRAPDWRSRPRRAS
jgi:hypothetical protein